MSLVPASTDTTQTESESRSGSFSAPSLALLRVAPRAALESVAFRHGLLIGRDEACAVQTHTSSTSRRHARLSYQGHLWRCEDLESRNGTFLNGQSVQDAPIGPGDVLRCGGWVAVVVRRSVDSLGLQFAELAPGVYGGAVLRFALAPLRKIAPSALPVILEGETGTGKECVARAIHLWSGRSGPYLALNCAALPESLVEAELFGYERGAFTGATHGHTGHLRAAHGGTLLLDEICELPMTVQSKLLRALDQREVTPLGATRSVAIDVRVVAAAQRPLEAMVREGRFREDLLARLGMVTTLPPLRVRLEDVPLLYEVFARDTFGHVPELDPRAIEAMLLYHYPRNVRELRQVVEQLALLHPGANRIGRGQLPALFRGEGSQLDAPLVTSVRASAPTRRCEPSDWPRLREALTAHSGNVQTAARSIGISRYQAYRLLRAHPEFQVGDLRQS